MLFKKSVSPLIATILLIVVSVILITVVLTWAKGFTQNTTNKATDLLDQSKEIPKTGVFWQTSLLGDQLILRNQIIDDIEIKGYKILTNDYNSEYFWLNSYRPFENNITFSPSTLTPITLVCMPTNKFYLELIDINDQSYSLEINPINNRSFTSCNTFNVPLWEFETISGSYIINTFNKQSGNRVINGTFDTNVSGWTTARSDLSWQPEGYCRLTKNAVVGSMAILQTNMTLNKRYKISFYAKSNDTTVKPAIISAHYGGIVLAVNPDLSPEWQYYEFYGTASNITTVIYLPHTSVSEGTKVDVDNISIIEIDPLETITNGTKFLECTTAGRLMIPVNKLHGTYEFDLSFANAGNFLNVYLLNNHVLEQGNGYRILFGYRTGVYRITSGADFLMFRTPPNPTNTNTFYSLKLTISAQNEFTLYIKGGSFGNNWTLVSGLESGTNPMINTTYNNINYLLLNMSAGDRIANIKITPEIEN